MFEMKRIIIGVSTLVILLATSITLIIVKHQNSIKYSKQREKLLEQEYISTNNKVLPPQLSTEERILASMTPEQKVGQLFIFGIEGNQHIESSNKEFLKYSQPAGVILFERNITDREQLKNLIKEIQNTSKIPLFISIDQEGGVVPRIKWNEIYTRSPKEIRTGEEAYKLAVVRGKFLGELGFNMNFSPVAEYVTNHKSFIYPRTFNGTAQEVTNKATSTVLGYRNAGIISVVKHFPGHGNDSLDPHHSMALVNIKEEDWDRYIEPFRDILKETYTDAVMVGHIKFINIDKFPASISSEIIQNRLKNTLNYEGLIISDDMQMKALNSFGDPKQIAKQALEAGEDLLIYAKYKANENSLQKSVYSYILQEVKKGNMNIDEKVLKILRKKIKYQIIDINDYTEENLIN